MKTKSEKKTKTFNKNHVTLYFKIFVRPLSITRNTPSSANVTAVVFKHVN